MVTENIYWCVEEKEAFTKGKMCMEAISFSDIAIVSCGSLGMELNHLKNEGFLDTDHLFFTTPGFHEDIRELERQLIETINKAKKRVDKVLVVFRSYVDHSIIPPTCSNPGQFL